MDWLSTTRQAFALLFSGDAGLGRIIFVSLKVSLLAMLIAAPAAIGIGYLAGHRLVSRSQTADPIKPGPARLSHGGWSG